MRVKGGVCYVEGGEVDALCGCLINVLREERMLFRAVRSPATFGEVENGLKCQTYVEEI